jgi:cation transporter-like permease
MSGPDKPTEEDDKPNGRHDPKEQNFAASLAVTLLGLFAVLVVGSAAAYVALGFTSIGYYGASIGQVMQFALNVAIVSGAAISSLFVILAILHEAKWFRKRVRTVLKQLTEP